jgi:hypothetical protein
MNTPATPLAPFDMFVRDQSDRHHHPALALAVSLES